MFNKRNDNELFIDRTSESRLPEPKIPEPTADIRRRNVSVIGPTLRFKGELSANEDLVIEGQIEGTIAHQDKNLTIGKGGRVKADIRAKCVEILGEVEGDVRGDEVVRMRSSAVVTGNISSPLITMDEGAHFTGSIDMSAKESAKAETKTKKQAQNSAKVAVAGTAAQAHTGGT